jgi:hypothetical protein
LEENKTYQSVVETSFNEEAFLRALEKCEKEIYGMSFLIPNLLYQKIKFEWELKSLFKFENYSDTYGVGGKFYQSSFSERISKITHILSDFYFGNDDKTIAINALEIAYKKYSTIGDNSPQILGEFIFSIIKIKKKQSIYDPFCGLGGFLLEGYKSNNEVDLFGLDIMKNNVISILNRFELRGINPKITEGDFFKRENIQCDILVTDPPFGASFSYLNIRDFQTQNSSTFEFISLEKCFDNLKENGQLAIVLPDDVLIPHLKQKDGVYTDKYAEVRQFFQAQAEINLIVSLPETTYYSLGSTHKRSIVFFTKKKNPAPYQVYLAANKFGSKGVSEKLIKAFLDEIAIQYNNKTLPSISSDALTSWSADRLISFKNDLFKNDLPKVKLKEIVIPSNKDKIQLSENRTYNQVIIKKNGKIELIEKKQKATNNQSFTLLKKGHIIISSMNLHNGGIAVFDEKIEKIILSSSFHILELDNTNVLGEYLVALFNQDLMKDYVYNLTNKSIMPRISLLTLLEIEIPLLSLSEQQKFVDNALEIKKLEQSIKNIQDENSSKINQLFNSK